MVSSPTVKRAINTKWQVVQNAHLVVGFKKKTEAVAPASVAAWGGAIGFTNALK